MNAISGGLAAWRAEVLHEGPLRCLPIRAFGYVIHAYAPVLDENRRTGQHRPVVVVRPVLAPGKLGPLVLYRDAYWESPSRLIHPYGVSLPDTNGRGVCWVETRGPVFVREG